LVHAICELIERDATVLAELALFNPGVGGASYRAIDLATVPASTRQLVRRICRPGYGVRIIDITSDLGVPCFMAFILLGRPATPLAFGPAIAPGFGCHPDPAAAIDMALLETTQTVAGKIAGSREDLNLRARSLGRHERTQIRSREGVARMLAPEVP